jgi:hypothetical protein
MRNIRFSPNALFFWIIKLYQDNRDRLDDKTGKRRVVKIYNKGGTRSSKTWDIIQVLVMFCRENLGKKLYIGVYRDTMVKCRDNTLKDFKECFDSLGLERDIDYRIVEGQKIRITLFGNVIEFMGLPESGVQAARMDICYLNEGIECQDWDVVKGLQQRTEMLFLCDWNPNVTVHPVFEQNDFNVFYTDTNYLDNRHLSEALIADYEGWCPWDFRDAHIEEYNHFVVGDRELCFRRWVWDKPECPVGVTWDDRYRRVNEVNLERKTIDKFRWLVYGEGIPCARDGQVFLVDWINSVPECSDVVFGLDFGYTNDPSVLTRVSREGKDLNIEYLTYQACRETAILFELVRPILEEEESRRKDKAGGLDYPMIVIACDSSDKYRDIHFVRELNMMCKPEGKRWQFVKVKKPHIATRISLVNRFNLKVVRNAHSEKEIVNYVYTSVNGVPTNIPVDKWNHGIDSFSYAVWYFFRYYFS